MPNGNGKILKYVFDIDGTICDQEINYADALPHMDIIQKINQLQDAGNEIVFQTARGTKTGIDWRDITERQLKEWGVRYTELHFGKPAADIYVDDKGCHINDFSNDDFVECMTTVEKRWGKEYLLDVSQQYAMKRLCINAGQNISLQYHAKKRETWHIVSGVGIAKIDGVELRANVGDTFVIPAGVIHQIKAITDLVIIESSTTELDDIVRIKEEY